MKQRNLIAMFFLVFVTLGIYPLYWFVTTKGELNGKGAEVPTAWLLLIPIVNIWWVYMYFVGAEKVTNGKANAVLYFVLGIFVTSILSMLLAQNEYNKLSA